MLSMAKVSKNDLEVWLSISVAKIFLPGSYKFRKVFFNHGSCWRKRRWNSLYGHFSQKNAPVHASTGARARACPSTHFIQLHCTGLAQEEHVSKEVCFWLWGKDNLVQLPEEPSITWTVDASSNDIKDTCRGQWPQEHQSTSRAPHCSQTLDCFLFMQWCLSLAWGRGKKSEDG